MTTYKGVVGTAVQNVAGSEGTASGQLWFNSTASTFQYQHTATVNAWSTGNSLNVGRYGGGGAGTQTAAFLAGGQKAPGLANETELYNGTNWSTANTINTARRYFPGVGTTTAGLIFGGTPPDTGATESYNGTNWTEVADLNTARQDLAGAGANNTAALAFGGHASSAVSYTHLTLPTTD